MKVIYSTPVCGEIDKAIKIAKTTGNKVEKIVLTDKEWGRFMYELCGEYAPLYRSETLRLYEGVTVVKGEQ